MFVQCTVYKADLRCSQVDSYMYLGTRNTNLFVVQNKIVFRSNTTEIPSKSWCFCSSLTTCMYLFASKSTNTTFGRKWQCLLSIKGLIKCTVGPSLGSTTDKLKPSLFAIVLLTHFWTPDLNVFSGFFWLQDFFLQFLSLSAFAFRFLSSQCFVNGHGL